MAKRSYHHGDLRRALLDGAVAFLREGDVTALTMQVVAKAAGVSAGAPYHHFADKATLLGALATEGFDKLFEKLSRADKGHDSARARLESLIGAYLGFAAKHPEYYRVMFLQDIEDRVRFHAVHESSARSLSLVMAALLACVPSLTGDALMAHTIAALSTCHGFASLRAAGVLSNIPGAPSLAVLQRAAIAQVVAQVSAAEHA